MSHLEASLCGAPKIAPKISYGKSMEQYQYVRSKSGHAGAHFVKCLTLAGSAFLAAAAVATPSFAAEFDPYAGTILFPAPNGSQFGYGATWATTPTNTEIRNTLPDSVTMEGRTNWACHVSSNGQLHDCAMQIAWRDDSRYEAAGRKLLSRFVLSPASSLAAQTNNAQVIFEIWFYGAGLKRPSLDQCPPPFCSAVPPPPPPPPPPPSSK